MARRLKFITRNLIISLPVDYILFWNVSGTGYQLNLLTKEGCDVVKITNTIQPIIPAAEMKSEVGTVLCYMLPSEQCNRFPDLFDVLEREKQELCISSIGVSITTLDEVFLRLVGFTFI
jgi:ATP-binding cassette subfamily A (ABC1) protein 3